MILRFFRPNPQADIVADLYGAIVAQARQPVFYRDLGVPDTVNGRFEMVLLHTLLVIRRLAGQDEPVRDLGQMIFDRFCADIDGSLREMGVSDMKVPRQMRRVGDAFYGKQKHYAAAFEEAGDVALVELLQKTFAEEGRSVAIDGPRLATYLRGVEAALSRQEAAAIAAGRLTFPQPAQAAAAG